MLSLPRGFHASGIRSGISKDASKPDLALFYSERAAAAAAVFTKNVVQAAPVLLSRSHVRRGRARAILANSGCANACTGRRGLADARLETKALAAALSGEGRTPVRPEEVLVASTGLIGSFLPMKKVAAGIRSLGSAMGLGGRTRSPAGVRAAVKAIMTTDRVPKTAGRTFLRGACRVWGCAKGAGMIHPDMATMLAFIFTDARLPSGKLGRALRSAVRPSFNSLSVDGDTSTNDSVYLLANGMSGRSIASARDLAGFQAALSEVCASLARQIARDGEGATKFVEVSVRGARSDRDARRAAETIATSPLVKTALFGRDANWGRVMAAAGRSGARFDPDRAEVFFGPVRVAKNGRAAPFSESRARRVLGGRTVPVTVDFHGGAGRARYLTCDLSFDYVKINAEYRT